MKTCLVIRFLGIFLPRYWVFFWRNFAQLARFCTHSTSVLTFTRESTCPQLQPKGQMLTVQCPLLSLNYLKCPNEYSSYYKHALMFISLLADRWDVFLSAPLFGETYICMVFRALIQGSFLQSSFHWHQMKHRACGTERKVTFKVYMK